MSWARTGQRCLLRLGFTTYLDGYHIYTPRSLCKHSPRLEGEGTPPSSAHFPNVPPGGWRQIPWAIVTAIQDLK